MKKLISIILIIAISITGIFLATKLLEPKYMTGILEGAMIGEYYDDPTDHDVVFIGDSQYVHLLSHPYKRSLTLKR